jgi:hypothetical protein
MQLARPKINKFSLFSLGTGPLLFLPFFAFYLVLRPADVVFSVNCCNASGFGL